MKVINVVSIILICVQFLFPQELSKVNRFSINASIRTNFINVNNSTVGIKLGLNYNLNSNISFSFNTALLPTILSERSFIESRDYSFAHNDYFVTKVIDYERNFTIIPFDLSAQYNFSISSLRPYVFVTSGYDLLINYYSYSQKVETYAESTGQVLTSYDRSYSSTTSEINGNDNIWAFSLGIGSGIYVPVSDYFLLDFSYCYHKNSYINAVHSFGIGFKRTL
ncbi:MAG: hypothetical protein IPH97_17580 [Ignavibacteriales bacterium]|nr:hypothetical protein [Ignavibacteriales bacterium]